MSNGRRKAKRGASIMVPAVAGVLVTAGLVGFALTRGDDLGTSAGRDTGGHSAAQHAQSTAPETTTSSGTGSGTGTTATGSDDTSDTGTTGTGTAGTGTADACVAQVRDAEKVLAAARTGITHLKQHVGAHNRWVDGEISELDKASTYRRTKLAGPDDVAAYDAAVDRLGEDLSGCAGMRNRCAQRMGALRPALAGAERGMTHWRTHLANMGDFAAGKYDAAHAQHLWEGTINGVAAATATFDEAEAGVRDAPACA